MKNYVSALDLITLINEIGNAIVFSEHAINELKLNNHNHDLEMIWRDNFEVHFWDSPTHQQDAAKAVLEQLISSLCMANAQSLVIDEELQPAFDCKFDDKNFELDF